MGQKGYSGKSGGAGGGVNPTSGRIPLNTAGVFVDSALEETVDEVVSDKTIRANIVAPTGSIAFEDSSVLSTNTDTLEIEDCVRGERHEIIVDTYDETGSQPPRTSVKSAIQTFDIQLIDDAQSSLFEVILPTLNDVHFLKIIVIPKAAGMGRFVLRDTDENGCILNTETMVNFLAGDVGSETTVTLENAIKLFAGQDVWVSYEGPALGGTVFGGAAPVVEWNNNFVPYAKGRSLPYEDKFLALSDNVLEKENTTPYTPTLDYHPATLKSVQDLISTCAGFKGVYADLASLQTAHPTANLGDIATVTNPNGNLFYWDGLAWTDTGTGYIGDMLKLIYDPTGVNGNAFAMANMVENGTNKILTATERTEIVANTVHKSSDGKDHSDVVGNNAKISADGSVTTHNDVTSAGSGSIITSTERTNLNNQSGTNTGDEPDASETVKGIVERATDAEASAGTDTTRYVTPKQLKDNSGLGYVLATWGANLQNVGRHPAINGPADGPEIPSLGISASAEVPAEGTIDAITYYNTTGDNTTTFQIIKNGVVVHTFTCIGPYGVETNIGVPTGFTGNVADNIAIRYVSGTAPGAGFYSMYIN